MQFGHPFCSSDRFLHHHCIVVTYSPTDPNLFKFFFKHIKMLKHKTKCHQHASAQIKINGKLFAWPYPPRFRILVCPPSSVFRTKQQQTTARKCGSLYGWMENVQSDWIGFEELFYMTKFDCFIAKTSFEKNTIDKKRWLHIYIYLPPSHSFCG